MIDVQTLLDSAGDDLELAVDLLSLFDEQVRAEMGYLTDAACNGDAALAASIAHKLVGSAVACGFSKLSKELRSMELQCLQNMPDDIAQQIGNLKQLFKDGYIEMSSLLKGRVEL